MELSRMILRFSSWVTRWIVQQFTDWVLRRKKRLEVVGIDDEFLICPVDQGVFWAAEGKFPSGFIGQKLRREICTLEIVLGIIKC